MKSPKSNEERHNIIVVYGWNSSPTEREHLGLQERRKEKNG